jgi:Na+-translocating ferredoxin:NAD+ oxidoreductase subunit G
MMKMKEKRETQMSKYGVPTLVLVVICVLVTGALAFTYGVTAPIIQKNLAEQERLAAEEVLGGIEGVALKAQVKSYGGKLQAIVGISQNGEITGVKILSHSDTPGLGTQPMAKDYLKQYIGLTELKADHINDDQAVDAVTGATISSNAIYHAVQQALADYKETGGGQQ